MEFFTDYLEYWIPALVTLVAIAAVLAVMAVRAQRNRVTTGNEGIIGEIGVYQGNGLTLVHGELWKTVETTGLEENAEVEVVAVDRLKIKVKKL